ncbi:hypothetical protein AAZX31_08G331100 [Glycine max]|uniref:Uncharacterized protein n=2 Tax=Glycine subgen. Soja TaxID=1462606 RepID=A0A0R0IWE9_SOYBN|nr:Trypsin inhibitor A [Glycine soja]
MKSPTIFILFLLSAFYTSLLPSATAQVVLDTEVVSSYGGIRVAATGKERRPLTVVQSPNPFDKGIGTIISSPYRSYFIGESFPVNMTFGNFAVILPCVPLRSEWTVVNGQPEGPAVKIESVNFGLYKLVLCTQPERSTCQHIGIHVDDENHARLVLTNDDPLEVKFEKDNHFWPQNNLVLPRSE